MPTAASGPTIAAQPTPSHAEVAHQIHVEIGAGVVPAHAVQPRSQTSMPHRPTETPCEENQARTTAATPRTIAATTSNSFRFELVMRVLLRGAETSCKTIRPGRVYSAVLTPPLAVAMDDPARADPNR